MHLQSIASMPRERPSIMAEETSRGRARRSVARSSLARPLVFGLAAASLLRARRSHAQPLRRARAPRRRAAHPRQSHAGLAADRRASGCRCRISSTCCRSSWMRGIAPAASAIAISILVHGVGGVGARPHAASAVTGSWPAAIAGAALHPSNPNVLYLQSTPMTEPLLFGHVAPAPSRLTAHWLDRLAADRRDAACCGIAAGCRVSDPLRGVAVTAAVRSRSRSRSCSGAACRFAAVAPVVRKLACWPAVAIAVFTINSRWVVGDVVRQRRVLRSGERRGARACRWWPGGSSMKV